MREFNALQEARISSWVHRIWLVTVTIVILFVSMLFLPWQQTVKGEGALIAHNPSERGYSIASTVDGFVNTLYVRENQYVKKGDKLFTMTDLDSDYAKRIVNIDENINNQLLYTKEEFVTLKKNRSNLLEQMQTGSEIYDKKSQQALDEIKSLELKKTAAAQNFEVEELNFERVKQLYAESIESKRSVERATNSYVKAKAELDKIEVDLRMQKRQIGIIASEKEQFLLDTSNQIRTIENSTFNAQVRLNGLQRENEKQATDIARYNTSEALAQKDGYVVKVLVNDKNRYLSKGESVIEFAPEVGVRTLLLKVSDFNMPLIQKGLPVRIMFYGWPAMQVAGWPKIKYGTYGGVIEKVDPIAYEKGFYYAYIIENPKEPWPSKQILRLGTRATVWVRLSTVPIWYQLWRMMNALPPKMLNLGPET